MRNDCTHTGASATHRARIVDRSKNVRKSLVPRAIRASRPPGWRRKVILGLTGVGALVCAWDISGLIFLPSRCFVEQNSIAYRNPATGSLWVSYLYILATCGALLLSTHRVVRWYGVLNVVALTIAEIVKEYAFASVWCFYAAMMSVMIYWQFKRLVTDTNDAQSDARNQLSGTCGTP